MEVSGQLHAPAALPPGKEPLVPIGQEAGWAPEPFWMQCLNGSGVKRKYNGSTLVELEVIKEVDRKEKSKKKHIEFHSQRCWCIWKLGWKVQKLLQGN
jgi:hypothetical protein